MTSPYRFSFALHRIPRLQKTLNPRHRLSYPLIVLHQRKTDMAFPVGAEADSRGDGHQRLVDQALGKLERSQVPVGLRNGRPDEHRSARWFHRPPGAVQTVHQRIAAALVCRGDLLRVLLAFAERDDRRDLDGLEHPVIHVALDPGERGDEPWVAEAEADAPAGHVVALREREDFDG